MTEPLIVHITAEDIETAARGDYLDCPISAALERQYPGATWAVSDTQVYSIIDGRPGPTYNLSTIMQTFVTLYDVDTVRRKFGYDTGGLLIWPESFVLEPAPAEIIPMYRRDVCKSVHSSKV